MMTNQVGAYDTQQVQAVLGGAGLPRWAREFEEGWDIDEALTEEWAFLALQL